MPSSLACTIVPPRHFLMWQCLHCCFLPSAAVATCLLSLAVRSKPVYEVVQMQKSLQVIVPIFHSSSNAFLLFFHSVGEPVELSSRFIRYSTLKTGKEQLVSGCACLLGDVNFYPVDRGPPPSPGPPPPPPPPHTQVNCGNLDSLLERLVKVSHYGLDFLNTFLMTFPLYTTAHHVLDFLSASYHSCVSSRERKRSGSITPQDAVRDARGESH